MRLLLVNPNTSAHITARMAAAAGEVLAAGESLTPITACDRPAVVRCEVTLREADDNARDLAHAHAAGHDAVLLAASS